MDDLTDQTETPAEPPDMNRAWADLRAAVPHGWVIVLVEYLEAAEQDGVRTEYVTWWGYVEPGRGTPEEKMDKRINGRFADPLMVLHGLTDAVRAIYPKLWLPKNGRKPT